MIQPKDTILICPTATNGPQLAVLLHSLKPYYTGDLLVAHSQAIPAEVSRAIEDGGWPTEILTFQQAVPEAGLVVKAVQRLFDSSYGRVLYLASHTLVQGPISEVLTVNLDGISMAAALEYDYASEANADAAYRSEDPAFQIRHERHGMGYRNTDVALFNMRQIRRSQLDPDRLFDRFWEHPYAIELGLCEFMNLEMDGHTIAVMPRQFNYKADRYLHNTRAYHKLIRSHKTMAEAPIANYCQAKPWERNLALDRLTIQVPMHRYQAAVAEIAEHLPTDFVDNVNANAQKWENRIGALPIAVEAFHSA